MLKKIVLMLVAVFVIIQFFHPEKNNTDDDTAKKNDISKLMMVPADVHDILVKSCYDCHSNNTDYPWYAEIQPVSWWLNNHIEEGKSEMNFNEFSTYSIRRQYRKLEEIIEEVKEDEMPLSSYTFIHKDALLNKEQKLLLTTWAGTAMDSLKARYPADSFVRKN